VAEDFADRSGHFDPNTALRGGKTRWRIDDLQPHIFATHDSGKTWTEIANGNTCRPNRQRSCEDPDGKISWSLEPEKGVYVSFDDGATGIVAIESASDFCARSYIKNDDLIVGTHGRGFWISDNINAAPALNRNQREILLFKPQTALLFART